MTGPQRNLIILQEMKLQWEGRYEAIPLLYSGLQNLPSHLRRLPGGWWGDQQQQVSLFVSQTLGNTLREILLNELYSHSLEIHPDNLTSVSSISLL